MCYFYDDFVDIVNNLCPLKNYQVMSLEKLLSCVPWKHLKEKFKKEWCYSIWNWSYHPYTKPFILVIAILSRGITLQWQMVSQIKLSMICILLQIAIIQNNNDKFVSDLRQVGGFFGFHSLLTTSLECRICWFKTVTIGCLIFTWITSESRYN
jgi:hypothetical protein